MIKYLLSKSTFLVIVRGLKYQLERNEKNQAQIVEILKLAQQAEKAEKEGSSDFDMLCDAIIDSLSPARRIEHQTDGRFIFDNVSNLYLKGAEERAIPELLAERILEFLKEGLPVDALVNFWKNCLLNPDDRAIDGLYRFLEHNGHPITPGGYFVAYKKVNIASKYDTKTGEEVQTWSYDENTGERIEQAVNANLTFVDIHTGKMRQKVGEVVSMERSECEHNPDITCSSGLHVASWEYAGGDTYQKGGFNGKGGAVVEVLINPRHVVSVPYDYNGTKMRCCQYYILGIVTDKIDSIFKEVDYVGIDNQQLEQEFKDRIELVKKEQERLGLLFNK